MISYLKGTIHSLERECATIIVNGAIGFSIFMNERDLQALTAGQNVEIFCYHHITDRSQELYGFLYPRDKTWFVEIVNYVSGIGPKSALKILAKNTTQALQEAVGKADIDRLISYGIGKKTGEKIIAALKGRMKGLNDTAKSAHREVAYEESLDALVALGYTKSEGEQALQQIERGTKKTEILVKEALRLL